VTNSNEPEPPDATRLDTPRSRHAYAELEPELLLVPRAELVTVNIGVAKAVTNALGVLPGLRALEPELISLPGFAPELLGRLEQLTLATGYAHARYLRARLPPPQVAELAARGMELRAQLVRDLRALAARGLVRSAYLDTLKLAGPNGYRALPFDLMAVAAVIREHWQAIDGKTGISPSELDAAEQLAEQLLVAIGQRDHPPVRRSEAADLRQRAFSLFVNTYDEIRIGVMWTRRKQRDVDEVMPSLYRGRGKKKAAQAYAKAPDGESPVPPTSDTVAGDREDGSEP
jgi:hypothetical protein